MNMPVPEMMDQGQLATYEHRQGVVVPDDALRLQLITHYFGRLPRFSDASENIRNNVKWEAHTTNIADTLQHQEDTAKTALALATTYYPELSPLQRSILYCAAMYHDVGKFEMKPEIIFKPGKFTAEEYKIVQTHAQLSSKITGDMEIADFNLLISAYNKENPEHPLVMLPDDRRMIEEVADLVLTHHEHCDGKGYPHRIVEKDLSILSRILTVADVYDALISDRVYRGNVTPTPKTTVMGATKEICDTKRKAYTPSKAIAKMLGQGAEKFDITIVACLQHMVQSEKTPHRPKTTRTINHAPAPAPVLGSGKA
ncbi:MAG: HD domain-containing protein [Alphaproteobacteria bacterium]|nr:HD domain-containing protein [Alphaproteobacteria bacterium]